jgi:hypothetical protein
MAQLAARHSYVNARSVGTKVARASRFATVVAFDLDLAEFAVALGCAAVTISMEKRLLVHTVRCRAASLAWNLLLLSVERGRESSWIKHR